MIPPEFLEELKARLPATEVVGRRVKLIRSGRDTKGCCPFHKEKTPSFHVYDDHYHCFGCGAHGSVIDFVMESEGLEFREAVQRLAGEAGLPMPEETPEDRERRARNRTLAEVVEMAAAFFEKCLRMPEGRPALDYLRGRGLTDETIRRFRLGFSPDGRGKLKSMLAAEGVEEGLMVEAGLVIRAEEDGGRASLTGTPGAGATAAPSGARVYDRFRGRVMFPITDRGSWSTGGAPGTPGGRVIAFGARLLAGDGPKYLNSPETPLFHKGRTLYGLAQAKDAIRSTGRVIVCEGYTDVLALAQAGFAEAAAPLGTALTEDQLALLWRLAPEPVLCFDGDDAGWRAAVRAAGLALPHLRSGLGLRFVHLPSGTDPDQIVRAAGPQAFDDLVSRAIPLTEMIWRIEGGDRRHETPEAKAALGRRLGERARDIADPVLRRHFQSFVRDRLWGRAAQGSQTFRLAGADARPVDGRRLGQEAVVAAVINHPFLMDDDDLFLRLDLPEDLDALRVALAAGGRVAPDAIMADVIPLHAPFALPGRPEDEVRRGWRTLARRLLLDDMSREIAAAAGKDDADLAALVALKRAEGELRDRLAEEEGDAF